MAMVPRIQCDDVKAQRAGAFRHIVEELPAVTFAPGFGQRTQVVNVKVFAAKEELKVSKADRCYGYSIFFYECKFITLLYHLLHQWDKGVCGQMWAQFQHHSGAFCNVFWGLGKLYHVNRQSEWVR